LNSSPSPLSFISPSSIPGTVLTGFIFPFTHVCAQ
jgi:hypothetical protein